MEPDRFWEYHGNTEPKKLTDLSPEDLERYLGYFSQAHHANWSQKMRVLAAEGRVALLQNEIERRRLEAHHGEIMTQAKSTHFQGEKILFWARWAVAVGVAVPIIVALIQEIPLSKLLPAKSLPPQQTPQTTLASATPETSESATVSPTASPTLQEASTPEQSPL